MHQTGQHFIFGIRNQSPGSNRDFSVILVISPNRNKVSGLMNPSFVQ